MQKYFGQWKSVRDVISAFGIKGSDLKDEEVLFADGYSGRIEGDAYVLLDRGGFLYEVRSFHCSCNGFHWDPQPITWRALALRIKQYDNGRDGRQLNYLSYEGQLQFRQLVRENLK